MKTLKHTIVYAEDDLDDLFILKQAFEKHDHIDIVHAPDGKMAIVILENMVKVNVLPCLVLLDINMPVMNGRETLKAIRLRQDLQLLPVILFSTSNSSTDKQFAEEHGAMLVTKPADLGNLEAIAEHFLERCNFDINSLSRNHS